jgi:hypothetical protein
MFAPAYMGRKRRVEAIRSFHSIEQLIQHGAGKSNRKYHFRPRYTRANLGYPSRSYPLLL